MSIQRFALFSCTLLLCACLTPERDTGPNVLHGIEVTPENHEEVQKMDADEYSFLSKVLGQIAPGDPQARVFNNLGRPAKDVVIYGIASRKLWTVSFANSSANVSVYFDNNGEAIRIELDGGDAYHYAQNLRELTSDEKSAIAELLKDPEFAEYDE